MKCTSFPRNIVYIKANVKFMINIGYRNPMLSLVSPRCSLRFQTYHITHIEFKMNRLDIYFLEASVIETLDTFMWKGNKNYQSIVIVNPYLAPKVPCHMLLNFFIGGNLSCSFALSLPHLNFTARSFCSDRIRNDPAVK